MGVRQRIINFFPEFILLQLNAKLPLIEDLQEVCSALRSNAPICSLSQVVSMPLVATVASTAVPLQVSLRHWLVVLGGWNESVQQGQQLLDVHAFQNAHLC